MRAKSCAARWLSIPYWGQTTLPLSVAALVSLKRDMGSVLHRHFKDLFYAVLARRALTNISLKAVVPGIVIFFSVAPTAVYAEEAIEALTGFYAVDDASCQQPKGMLLLCEGTICLRQEYETSVPLQPNSSTMRGTVATVDTVDANGFNIKAGDVTFNFERAGANNIQVVRLNGDSLQTTYLARTNNGKVGFAFIEDGVSKDPSASAAPLQLCPAYSANAADWLAEGKTPLNIVPAAVAPKGEAFDVFNRKLSEIELRYEAPKENAWVTQIVPVSLDDPEYPALFVFWVFAVGGTPLPIQILTYDHSEQAYVDTTAIQFRGEIPNVDYAASVTVDPIGVDGRMGILIAAAGMDAHPFPRTMNTLLLRNGEGKFVDRSVLLPRELHLSHDSASGIINSAGDTGIFINNMFVPEYYVGTGNGKLVNRREWLPDRLEKDGPKFTVSALADLNGDGLADLVLGPKDSLIDPAVFYLNNGEGRFDRSEPVLLPKAPFPDRVLPITKKVIGATYTDIQAIRLDPNQGYDDLVVVSNMGYEGYAIQILKNDGNSNLRDATAELIDGDEITYYKNDETPFSYVSRGRVFAYNGGYDILVKSQSVVVPSYVFRRNGDTFLPSEPIWAGAIENAATFADVPLLIRTAGQEIALTAYPK